MRADLARLHLVQDQLHVGCSLLAVDLVVPHHQLVLKLHQNMPNFWLELMKIEAMVPCTSFATNANTTPIS